ncbi:MAG: hypothetical protein WCJ61_06910, partial [Paludibacter sp.]
MTTTLFIKNHCKTITVEGQNLITEFFITFSRFECALKVSKYTRVNNQKVSANWDEFIQVTTQHQYKCINSYLPRQG